MIPWLLALFSGTSGAWTPVEPYPYVWTADQMPIGFYTASNCPDQHPPGSCVDDAIAAFEAWEGLPCSPIAFEHLGTVDPVAPEPTEFGMTPLMLDDTVWFVDPYDVLEPGVLAASVTQRFGLAWELDGEPYGQADAFTIWVNSDDAYFVTQATIDAGQCEPGQAQLQHLLQHEVGHVLGLGHSCDEGEVCSDPDLQDALMFWQIYADCDQPIGPRADDIAGIKALYGPRVSVHCTPEEDEAGRAIGVAPLDVRCTASTDGWSEDVDRVVWSFGDGGAAEGRSVLHRFEQAGAYAVTATIEGASDTCTPEDFTTEGELAGTISVCGVPEVVFEVQPADKLTYAVWNRTDPGPLGCTDNVVWTVYEGEDTTGSPVDSMTTRSWEPTFVFERPGQYTVVGNVGGIAGTGAARLTFRVRRAPFGCATGGGAPGWSWMVLSLLVLGRRQTTQDRL